MIFYTFTSNEECKKHLGMNTVTLNAPTCVNMAEEKGVMTEENIKSFFFLHTEDTYEVYIADTQFPVMLKFESNV